MRPQRFSACRFQQAIKRESRVRVVLLWSVTMVVAMGAAGCDSATEPPSPGVRIEAITTISFTGTVGAEVEPAPAVRATDECGRKSWFGR